MLTNPSPEEQAVLEQTLRRPRSTLTARERVAEALLSLGFGGAVAVLWISSPPQHLDLAPGIISVLVLIFAVWIRIDTPFGHTYPTQLAFVPLLFTLPGPVVPLAVAVAGAVSRLPDVFAGEMRPSRLVHAIPNAWYAIGPVAVLALARTTPGHASALILLAALAAQCIVDFAASGLRYAICQGATVRELLGDLWVYVVDAALSVVALVVAVQIHHGALAALAPVPLLALVGVFARERRQRLESLITLNTAYRQARDEAIEGSNMKSAFLRNVSHEVRTPMNGVMGMNELLLSTSLTDEQREYALQVERSSEHMLAVINDLLDISKIETGRIELEAGDFDLREAIDTTCAVVRVEAEAKELTLSVEVSPGVPAVVRGDVARIRQVLMNLLGNAVKFTPAGSVTVRVSAAAPAAGDRIRVEISDTGIGIDPATLESMFQPFTQADVSLTRAYGGNGLGLAIAKELIELMGGTMGVETELGQGSTFWFEVPLPSVHVEAPEPEAHERLAPLSARGPSPAAPLVLIVEDSPVNRLVAQRVVERCGFRSHVVNDGREALDALAAQNYAAVLMDCQMPEIDGYAATRELRRREQGKRHTPVIAMTAHAMSADRDRCIEAGMDDYITKPVRSQKLAAMLERWARGPSSAADASARGRAARDQRISAARPTVRR
ncbi:MAG: ATP-binding protein [Solirubrobacteraceae bacterium]